MAARALTDPTTTPFDPRAVEVLAAALPPQGVNPIGLLARAALVGHAQRLTPTTSPTNSPPPSPPSAPAPRLP